MKKSAATKKGNSSNKKELIEKKNEKEKKKVKTQGGKELEGQKRDNARARQPVKKQKKIHKGGGGRDTMRLGGIDGPTKKRAKKLRQKKQKKIRGKKKKTAKMVAPKKHEPNTNVYRKDQGFQRVSNGGGGCTGGGELWRGK